METPYGSESLLHLKELLQRPFVQADELRAVNGTIPANILSDEKILRYWLDVAVAVQEQKKNIALAFNQLDDELLQVIGFNKKIPAHVIFFGAEEYRSPFILLNSTVTADFQKPIVPKIEACGSIDHGNMVYVYGRPTAISVTGYLYDQLGGRHVSSHDEMTRMLFPNVHHEDAHIHGRTVLNDPGSLWDIRKFDIWMKLCRSYNFRYETELRNELEALGKHGLVVPDHLGGYEIVGLDEVGLR